MGEAVRPLDPDSNGEEPLELVHSVEQTHNDQIFQQYSDYLLATANERSHDIVTQDSTKVRTMVGIIAAASFFEDGALPLDFPKVYRSAEAHAVAAGQDEKALDKLENVYALLGGWGEADKPRHEAVKMLESLSLELGRGTGGFTREEFVAIRRRVLSMALRMTGDDRSNTT